MIAIGGFGLMVLLIFLFLLQSNKTPSMDDKAINFDLTTKQTPIPSPTPPVTELQVQDISIGTSSAQVVAGDKITFHYAAAFMDKKIFDNSYARNQPMTVVIGIGQVIPGIEQGVVGMKIGGKRNIIVPANLAYGEKGQAPIPPNTPLIFQIELLNIEEPVTPTPSPAVSSETTPTPTP